jgi:vanillate O-demethylase monooxygenase subunit
MLINDNLLDLSHIPFLHRNSLGASLTPEGISKPTITKMARGVRIQNWLKGGPSRMIPSLNNVSTDILQTYDFVIPGVFLLSADFYPEGAARKFPDGLTTETEPIHRQFTCQAVTPLTSDTTCYFFAYGPWAKEAQLIDSFYELSIKAFNEDRVMIEAQQKNINASNGAKMLTTSSDGGLSQFRRMMDEFIRAESQNGNATLSANGR